MDKRKEPKQPSEADVLRNMLATPPTPHKTKEQVKPKKRTK
jgi:hypothetical protein